MAREDNLKSFKKGQSGNPAGKPKGIKNRGTLIKKYLALMTELDNPANVEEKIEGTIEDKLVAAQLIRAFSGDTIAFREIMDSVYGKIPQKTLLGGDEDNPIQHEHSFDAKNMTDEQLRQIAAGKI